MKLKRWFISIAAVLASSLTLAAVDINKATEAELDGVKGIGPATTKLIMAERKIAPFADWSDVSKRVKGIGAKRAAKLSNEGLVVNGKSLADADKLATAQPRHSKTDTK